MPGASSVVLFLLLISICCILSLSSIAGHGEEHDTPHGSSNATHDVVQLKVSTYVPKIAMIGVMFIGIVAMLVFIFKRGTFTEPDRECRTLNRHNLHRTYALWSITIFFVAVCTLSINYLVVELSCTGKWTGCDHNGREVFLVNLFEVIFRIFLMVFASCETIVCWMVRSVKLKPSQWVWHGLAVVQAANAAVWFDSLLEESLHRVEESVHSFHAYFSFCGTESKNGHHSETNGWCTESSIAARWFVISSPFLYPITIEFSLLVSESFICKIIGESTHDEEHTDVDDQRRMDSSNPCISAVFIVIFAVINIIFLVLSILVFIGFKSNHPELKLYDNVFIVYLLIYHLSLNVCCIVGIHCCRNFRRQRSHNSFLEYLLLFATTGVLFRSCKRVVAFVVIDDTSSWISAYYMEEAANIIQVLLQNEFYFYAKDVKLPLIDDGMSAIRAAVFRSTVVAISITNFAAFISDSFLLPEMSDSITPSNYLIEPWPVFDNVVTPMYILFRFNSALLFWCISSEVSRSDELHGD